MEADLDESRRVSGLCLDAANGSREPGPEAIDFYSSLKNVYVTLNPGRV